MTSIQSLTNDRPILTHEHKVVAQDGQIRWQRWTNRVVLDETDKIISYQAIGEDITGQKEAENKLRESNLRHETMIENIGDVIGIIAIDGMTIYQSPNYGKVFWMET